MNAKRLALLGTALCAMVVTAPQASAHDGPLSHEAARSTSALAADGMLYSYNEPHFVNLCNRWAGNSVNWGGCQDASSSLKNLGYPGNLDDVFVYEGINYTGFRRGLYQGAQIADNRAYTFDGTSLSLDGNISSHHWTNLP